MRSDLYQYALIFLGVVSTLFFGAFLYREIFPEYRIYQKDYVALEDFRSSYTGQPAPAFIPEIKQIVFERDDKGPPPIDRCVSCHVALQIPDFSPTKIAKDINGNILLNEEGIPVKVPNEDYIWTRLDQKIAQLTDSKVIEQLKANGETSKANNQIKEAEDLKQLKTATVDGHVYDVTKVLQMHPLIGRETRAFEFHPISEYGCTVCHNGNGRGLTTEKAHGPVFDGEYDIEFIGPEKIFTEPDPKNDPDFAKAYNHKPGHELLFQTTPIFIGSLIQAKCLQCHQTSEGSLSGAMSSANRITEQRDKRSNAVRASSNNEIHSLIALLQIRKSINAEGVFKALDSINKKSQTYTLPPVEVEHYASQANQLKKWIAGLKDEKNAGRIVLEHINQSINFMLGSQKLTDKLYKEVDAKDANIQKVLDKFLIDQKKDPDAKGNLFVKLNSLDLEAELVRHVEDAQNSFSNILKDPHAVLAMQSDIDALTKDYKKGQELYLAQACYACHRIGGFSRGGVGPELTRIGTGYPWYIKKKLVWPQFDLKTSNMPNMHLDHAVLEDLMTFLMAQTGNSKVISESQYKGIIQEWEGGKKQPFEEPITPSQIHDLDYSMTVFATQGCAACHRLKGFESSVGYEVEKGKDKVDFNTRYKESEWFQNLIPETIESSDLVKVLEQHEAEIDKHIVNNARKKSILDKIEESHPGIIITFNTPFAYALRAKNSEYSDAADAEKNPVKKKEILLKLQNWKNLVNRVQMVFIEEYGLGRLIGPRPNWSGVMRSDEWLMEHFHRPTSHVANSIMPVLPFDDTKFYALTYMLDVLGKRNRDSVREIWENRGFNPEQAYEIHCAQCHGTFRNGNGPVSDWIYPIPKNLRNADFLRNLTKERVNVSIIHGVKGTPMPPWGETPSDKPTADGIPVITASEANQITNWLFSTLPGSSVIKGYNDVPKWQYKAEDVHQDLKKEGNELKSNEPVKIKAEPNKEKAAFLIEVLPSSEGYYAALGPKVNLSENENSDDIFDVTAPPVKGGPDKHGYYIKKKYYTEDNIFSGKRFFELNCAVCHGPEGDGKGIRAEVMQDAKPRMLTNLDWGDTRDDLRLLRSIKYGVSGTAMSPWGDLTSTLQRLQLVIFIRTLSEEQKKREQLQNAIYSVFDTADMTLQSARIDEFAKLAKIKKEYDDASNHQEGIVDKVKSGGLPPKEAVENYQKVLDLEAQVSKLQATDQKLIDLKALVNKESDFYQSMGSNLIINPVSNQTLDTFIKMVELNRGRYEIQNGMLIKKNYPKNEKEEADLIKQIYAEIDTKILELQKEKALLEGKIPSPSLNTEIAALTGSIVVFQGLKRKIISSFEEAMRAKNAQTELYTQIEQKLKSQETEKTQAK